MVRWSKVTPATVEEKLDISILQAANLVLSTTSTASSEVIEELQIDKADKLAGMKFTIDYPARFLEYKTAQKASAFNSFMQVVNDKKPGRLILVMASATGISGENLTRPSQFRPRTPPI